MHFGNHPNAVLFVGMKFPNTKILFITLSLLVCYSAKQVYDTSTMNKISWCEIEDSKEEKENREKEKNFELFDDEIFFANVNSSPFFSSLRFTEKNYAYRTHEPESDLTPPPDFRA